MIKKSMIKSIFVHNYFSLVRYRYLKMTYDVIKSTLAVASVYNTRINNLFNYYYERNIQFIVLGL